MRAITAVVAIFIGFGSVNAIGISKDQAAGQQRSAQQIVVPSKTNPEIVAKAIADKTGYKVTLAKKQKA